jgi:hypothetical protein
VGGGVGGEEGDGDAGSGEGVLALGAGGDVGVGAGGVGLTTVGALSTGRGVDAGGGAAGGDDTVDAGGVVETLGEGSGVEDGVGGDSVGFAVPVDCCGALVPKQPENTTPRTSARRTDRTCTPSVKIDGWLWRSHRVLDMLVSRNVHRG